MHLEAVDIKIVNTKMGNQFPLPRYATEGSAGLDLCACIDAAIEMKPNHVELIPTGIAIYLKNHNYVGLIAPRSGLGHKHGIVLGNLVGVIDADYQGELKISCWNRSNVAYTIEPGERIAQYIIVPVVRPRFNILPIEQAFSEITSRNEGGLGHTGSK